MYNVKWLSRVARHGISDLLPAVRQAFNDDPTDDRLELVYGTRPRLNIVVIAFAGIVAGGLFAGPGPEFPFKEEINWSAVIVAIVHAILIRRYLFGGDDARQEDFPWLAASLAPAAAALMLVSALAQLAPDADDPGTATAFIGDLLVAATDALGVVAALTIAVATLCFSRNWLRALWDLGVRLLVFRLTIWLTALIMLEIGIVGPIVSGILSGVFGFSLPEWIPELFDQLGYAFLLSVVYLAVIGATWMACKKGFAELLETGQVDVLATVARMAKDPEKIRKKQEKKARKSARKKRPVDDDADAGG